MAKKKVELTEGEWAIMEVVWPLGDCTAPDVRVHPLKILHSLVPPIIE